MHIIGGMATMPSRMESLKITLPSILRQVDHLYIYLDKYDEIPDLLKNEPKITTFLPKDTSTNFKGYGKFYALKFISQPSVYLTFDDDIIYPKNYAKCLLHKLKKYEYKAVVGIHGLRFKKPFESFLRSNMTTHFRKAVHFDFYVDALGSGTTAFHTDILKFNIELWDIHHMADLWLAYEAREKNIKLICLSRKKNFLLAIKENQDDSIWRRTQKNDVLLTDFVINKIGVNKFVMSNMEQCFHSIITTYKRIRKKIKLIKNVFKKLKYKYL